MSSTGHGVRVGAIGLAHPHAFGQAKALVAAGASIVALHASDEERSAEFMQSFAVARRVAELAAVLEDDRIDLVLVATAPDTRAGLAALAMRHGKDVLIAKPAAISLDQLAMLQRVQQQTGRILSVWFSERFAVRAATRASELVAAGAIGRVVHTAGLGPHRVGGAPRPDWFFDASRHGGILCDIGSHQTEQFLHYTGTTRAEVVSALVANHGHREHKGFEDFGEMMLRGDGCSGQARVDWLSADGLPTWGDGRLTLLGTEGHIELRKYVDPAGRPGGDHLFLVDATGTRHVDCRDAPLPFAQRLLADVRGRTETAMPQAHCLLAIELALRAQAMAAKAST